MITIDPHLLAFLPPTEPLGQRINQNGITTGKRKLDLIRSALIWRGAPPLYSQDGAGDDAWAYVKLFDPCGSASWFLTEWSQRAPDGVPNLAFGYVMGMCEDELGYISLEEIASVGGKMGIGMEVDCYFLPTQLRDVEKENR